MTDEPLRQLLQRCTVRLNVGGEYGSQGTGFFVAPGLILTCAHVVEFEGKEPVTVNVFWKEHNQTQYIAEIEKVFNSPDIDLALLKLTPDAPDHPCVRLEQSVPQLNDWLYIFGYPKEIGTDYSYGDSVTLRYEGESFQNAKNNSLLLKLKEGEIKESFSGSPILNLETGYVCGIVNLSRNTITALGGRAVPTRVILSQLNQLVKLQQQFHQHDRRWVETALHERELIRSLRLKQYVRDVSDARLDGGIINAILALPSVLGSAIGAGLGLGILRAAIAVPARQSPGVQLAISFFSAAILGAALALGMALVPSGRIGKESKQPDNSVSIDAAFWGALFFGIAHMVVALINGLWIESWLVVPMGFIAGLALSIVLYDQAWLRVIRTDDDAIGHTNRYRLCWMPCWSKWQSKIVGILSTSRYWLPLVQAAMLFLLLIREVSISIRAVCNLYRIRLMPVALTFSAIQIAFILVGDRGTGIVIARTGSFYKATFSRYETTTGWLMNLCPQWFNYLALLDAALVGIVLTLGIAIGSMLAHRWAIKWRNLTNQSSD